MSRENRRALKKIEQQYATKAAKGVAIAATSNKWTEWEEATPEQLSESKLNLLSAFWNNRYSVQVNQGVFIPEIGVCYRIMIRDNLARPIHNWHDFQRIKNELFGEEFEAIELYPKQSQLVDDANIYHLWILPQGYQSPFNFNNKVKL